MSENNESNSPLPPGWEYRYDGKTRRHYYVDNYNRTTTWDDPRPRYRSLLQQQSRQASPSHSSTGTGEMIALQHGGPLELRGSSTVYPCLSSYPPPPQPAFQLPATPFSHLAPNSILLQEFGSARPSPVLNRTILGATAFQHRSQQTADLAMSANTDELVAKIGATFPTAPETHIRLLLKKYHNREAVVVSALQVEKHPIVTPGPFSTPPVARNLHLSGAYTPIQMTPPLSTRGTPPLGIRSLTGTPLRGGIGTPSITARGSPPTRGSSPVPRAGSAASSYYGSPRYGDYRQSPRPHSSPKMKLRYLKSVFPKADETILLDVLSSEDNNVMRATDKLKVMGFEKKDGPPLKRGGKGTEDDDLSKADEERTEDLLEDAKPTPPPRLKSLEEKAKMKGRLEGLFGEIPERLIQIAIESAEYDEEKARQILTLMLNEKENHPMTESGIVIGDADATDNASTTATEVDGKKASRSTPKKEIEDAAKDAPENQKPPKVSRGTSTTEDTEFRSPLLQKPEGRKTTLRKGPNDQLLLVDYVTWHGPNSELRSSKSSGLAKGPSKPSYERRFTVKGPSKELRKGPAFGLAKGSIYSQLNNRSESRGQ